MRACVIFDIDPFEMSPSSPAAFGSFCNLPVHRAPHPVHDACGSARLASAESL